MHGSQVSSIVFDRIEIELFYIILVKTEGKSDIFVLYCAYPNSVHSDLYSQFSYAKVRKHPSVGRIYIRNWGEEERHRDGSFRPIVIIDVMPTLLKFLEQVEQIKFA